MLAVSPNDLKNSTALEIKFPDVMLFLLTEPARYKILYGGRGAGKTENIARAIVIFCTQKKLRVACFREFQNSIEESVHATIKNQIIDMGLEGEFDITDKTITSKRTGAEILFGKGLRYNINAIKSMARIDIAWVEEANNVSRNTWVKLGPTIRGRHESDPNGMGGPFGLGPEIWVSFNPELDSDETYKRFVLKPLAEYADDGKGGKIRYSICKKVGYWDNPWFPNDLRMEMEECKNRDYDEYLEVWEGHTKQVLDGSIYADEIRQMIKEERIGSVPYNPSKPVYTFWDLGHSDKTAIWFVQRAGMEFNVIRYYENQLKKMPFYIKYLQDTGYTFEYHALPHDGDDETLSNVTPKKQLQAHKYTVRIIERPSKKFLGINAARSVFPLCNFDEVNCADGLQCLKQYCYKVDEETGAFSKEPAHNTPWSHGADGFQTFALSLKTETESKKKKSEVETKIINLRPNATGWMGG